MSKKIKYLVLTLVVAGGAFGAAKVLNVDTSFLTGFTRVNSNTVNKTNLNNIRKAATTGSSTQRSTTTPKQIMNNQKIVQQLSQAVPTPATALKNTDLTQTPVALNQRKIDAVRNLTTSNSAIKELQQTGNDLARTIKNRDIKSQNIIKTETEANSRTRTFTNDSSPEAQRSSLGVAQQVAADNPSIDTEVMDRVVSSLAQTYQFFQTPELEGDNQGPPRLCLPFVTKQIASFNTKYYTLFNNLKYAVGSCASADDNYKDIVFSHNFNPLENDGDVIRFADADATKSYKITKIDENNYLVQYLWMDDAWEHVLQINPVNTRVPVNSLQKYGPFSVGLFSENDKLIVVSFR